MVRAQIIEIKTDGDLIFSFAGDLLRIKNQTGNYFKKDDFVSLQVKQLNPLLFQIASTDKTGLDVLV